MSGRKGLVYLMKKQWRDKMKNICAGYERIGCRDDPQSIYAFEEHEVIIPAVVLKRLIRSK